MFYEYSSKLICCLLINRYIMLLHDCFLLLLWNLLIFMDTWIHGFLITLNRSITKVNKYFVAILNSLIVLSMKYTNLNHKCLLNWNAFTVWCFVCIVSLFKLLLVFLEIQRGLFKHNGCSNLVFCWSCWCLAFEESFHVSCIKQIRKKHQRFNMNANTEWV